MTDEKTSPNASIQNAFHLENEANLISTPSDSTSNSSIQHSYQSSDNSANNLENNLNSTLITPNQNNSKPKSSSKFSLSNFLSRYGLYLAGGLVAIILIISGIWYWLGATGRTVNIFTPERLVQLDYVSSNLDWSENLRDERGVYADTANCTFDYNSQTWTCVPIGSSNRAFLPVIWAKYQYYLATEDQDTLTSLQNDIAHIHSVIIADPTYVIQNNSYNCLFINDMLATESEKNIFDDTQEQQLRDFCLESDYAIFDQDNLPYFIADPNLVADEIEIQSAIGAFTDSINQKVWLINNYQMTTYDLTKDEFFANRTVTDWQVLAQPDYYYFAQDALARYQLSGEQTDLLLALIMIDDALSLYLAQSQTTNENLIFDMADCHLTAIFDEIERIIPEAEIENLDLDFNFDPNQADGSYSTKCYLAQLHNASHDDPNLTAARQIIISKTGYETIAGDGPVFLNSLPISNNTQTDTIADILTNSIITGILSK